MALRTRNSTSSPTTTSSSVWAPMQRRPESDPCRAGNDHSPRKYRSSASTGGGQEHLCSGCVLGSWPHRAANANSRSASSAPPNAPAPSFLGSSTRLHRCATKANTHRRLSLCMEWECLGILLRGRQPIIWVPARSIIGMRLKPELQLAFKDGRLLILSFPAYTEKDHDRTCQTA